MVCVEGLEVGNLEGDGVNGLSCSMRIAQLRPGFGVRLEGLG